MDDKYEVGLRMRVDSNSSAGQLLHRHDKLCSRFLARKLDSVSESAVFRLVHKDAQIAWCGCGRIH